jgi:chromosome partitioning protein
MYTTVIPRNVRIAEAPSFGKPILLYDVQSVGAKAYLSLAHEVMHANVEAQRHTPKAHSSKVPV